ncbi:hypothetical protein CBW46_009280 [Paenibacillus xerothermodurans]|uniref:Transcription elongation factor GreA/GreB C-terminal domain-containing protein n=2 Tax=Paenibacillus xerothermodurans TaxID=1977292 RepID=A0A2W1NZD3_PAEXE|nr:hypothetical protein CBW46_009280 [Paenibacillus xerothermodurans]
MSHSILTNGFRDGLLKQLVYFDENKYNLLDKFASSTDFEKNQIDRLVKHYQKRVENILAGFHEDLLQSRVLIGSKVLLQFENEDQTETYHIVLPDETNYDNCISFLSPLGKGLLFAQCKDTIAIHTPQGEQRVLVLKNEYVLNTS